MEHESGWDTLDEDFVRTIIAIDVSQTLVTVCRPATAILIKLVSADKLPGSGPVTCYGYNFVHRAAKEEKEFLPTLVQRLQSPDYLLCLNSLELITTMLKHVTDEHRGDLTESLQNLNVRKFVIVSFVSNIGCGLRRQVLIVNITLQRLMNDHPSEELAAYLLDFQTAYTKNAHKRRKTIVSLSNPRHARLLNDIWQAANIEHVEVIGARKWKKIGFSVSVR